MPIDLTDADVPQWVRDFPGGIRIYRAGLAAGRERAIEECAKVCDRYEQHKWHIYKEGDGDLRADGYIQGQSDGAADCAAAIRSLNARSASADD